MNINDKLQLEDSTGHAIFVIKKIIKVYEDCYPCKGEGVLWR